MFCLLGKAYRATISFSFGYVHIPETATDTQSPDSIPKLAPNQNGPNFFFKSKILLDLQLNVYLNVTLQLKQAAAARSLQ